MGNKTRLAVFAILLCSSLVLGFIPHAASFCFRAFPSNLTIGVNKGPVPQVPSCGRLNDGQVHIPQDWTSFVPPPVGQSYVDPAFGCTIVRLTDSRKDGVAQHHYYATLTPVSADDSKVLLFNEHGQWSIVDPLGNEIVPANEMPAANQGVMVWDASDGNTFYFTRGNSLMKGAVRIHSGRKAQKTHSKSSVEPAVVHTFKEYAVVLLPDKSDLSVDGNSFAMWGSEKNEIGPLNIFTYNMGTNVKKTPYVTHCSQNPSYVQGSCVHALTQTADDNVIIDFASDGNCEECANRLWNGSALTKIQDATNHLDAGYDLSGNSILIEMGNARTLAGMKNPCPSGWGLDVRQLNNLSSAACLLDRQPSWHVSFRGSASQPWAAISFFDDRKPGPELFNDNKLYQGPSSANWQLYEDEIMLARIDGGVIYGLAHARSRSSEGFWATPRAAISRDGKYVVFDSNMAYAQTGCPTGMDSCADVYLIRVQ